jgi:hypothetical protein
MIAVERTSSNNSEPYKVRAAPVVVAMVWLPSAAVSDVLTRNCSSPGVCGRSLRADTNASCSVAANDPAGAAAGLSSRAEDSAGCRGSAVSG